MPPVKWNPTGTLNISADPSDLGDGDMVRCTNLHLDQPGQARTRFGSSKVSSTAVGTPVWNITEMGGNRYEFAGTAIYRNEVSIDTGYTSARWSTVRYNAYNVTTQSIFGCNGTEAVRVTGTDVESWGLAAPSAAPVLTPDNPGGGIAVGVVYTYAEYDGTTLVCESNPSTATETDLTDGDNLNIAWTASADSKVTHVNLYRTVENGAAYLFIDSIAIGTTDTDVTVDSTEDQALGSEVETDNDQPPTGMKIVVGPDFNGYLFGTTGDNLVYFSKANRPESWPADNYVECGSLQDGLKALGLFGAQVYAVNSRDIFQIQGTGVNSFFPLRADATAGVVGSLAMEGVKGKALFHLAHDGIWAFSGANDTKITDGGFAPIFRGDTVGSVPGVGSLAQAILQEWRGKLYFGYATDTYPNNWLVFDLVTNKTVHYQWSSTITCLGIDTTNTRLLAGDSSGYIWILEQSSQTTDGGTAISWQIQSKDWSELRAYMPRYARWDVDATATGSIVLEGDVIQTHSITSRDPKKRLITGNNGRRLALRVSGSGTAIIYGAEVE